MVSPIGSIDQSDLTNPMNYNHQTLNSNTGRSQPQNQAQNSLPPLNSIFAPVHGTTTPHELIPARLGAQPVFEPSSYVSQSRPLSFVNTQSVPNVHYHQIPSSLVQNQHEVNDTNVPPRLILPRATENSYPPQYGNVEERMEKLDKKFKRTAVKLSKEEEFPGFYASFKNYVEYAMRQHMFKVNLPEMMLKPESPLSTHYAFVLDPDDEALYRQYLLLNVDQSFHNVNMDGEKVPKILYKLASRCGCIMTITQLTQERTNTVLDFSDPFGKLEGKLKEFLMKSKLNGYSASEATIVEEALAKAPERIIDRLNSIFLDPINIGNPDLEAIKRATELKTIDILAGCVSQLISKNPILKSALRSDYEAQVTENQVNHVNRIQNRTTNGFQTITSARGGSNFNLSGLGSSSGNKSVVCYGCGQLGHKVFDSICPQYAAYKALSKKDKSKFWNQHKKNKGSRGVSKKKKNKKNKKKSNGEDVETDKVDLKIEPGQGTHNANISVHTSERGINELLLPMRRNAAIKRDSIKSDDEKTVRSLTNDGKLKSLMLDSGAEEDLTSHLEYLHNFVTFDPETSDRLSQSTWGLGGQPMKVLGEGTMKVKLTDDASKFTKVVEFKFLYCPGAGGSFLSEAQLIPYAVDFRRMEGVPFLVISH
ncbi:unnamed protein product [Ambrosiozyma monospora]|uniref:Unnamed protein product n=1 Tax=Ambrosiozyma monospora TaxID=43982 RepID=A0A9W7DHS3_AMBMO|nr:unnamed protein product [Ambrosiozyma monospora]